MKKHFVLLLFLFVSFSGYANNRDSYNSKYRVVTNNFFDNWFATFNMTGKSFYSDEENNLPSDVSKGLFEGYRTNIGLSLSLGKWFSQDIGLRTKLSGFWGKNVISDNASTNAIKYWNLQEQILLNLSNIIWGYDENRRLNIIPYGGVGVLRNCTDTEEAHGVSVGVVW